MKERIFYSHKFPKMSKLKTSYNFLSFLLFIISIIGVILSTKPMWEKLFFFPTALLFLLIIFRITLINKFLIREIEQVFEENSILSKKEKTYEALLQVDTNFAALRKKGRNIKFSLIFILIFFVILSKIINIESIYRFYFMWILILTGLTLIIVISLRNIFEYFRIIAEACYRKIIDNKDFKEFHLKRETMVLKWTDYEKKWRRLLIFMVSIAILILTIHIFLIKYQRISYLASHLINFIILGLITLDVSRIAEKCATYLESYDEYIKLKLGVTFKSSEPKTGYSVFLGEMKELNKSIKDIFK